MADRWTGGPPLGATATPEALAAELGVTITEEGLGVAETFRRFDTVVAPPRSASTASVPGVHPGRTDGGERLVRRGRERPSFSGRAGWKPRAVHAENEVLRFLVELTGASGTAGGCFVSGGSRGNRERWPWPGR